MPSQTWPLRISSHTIPQSDRIYTKSRKTFQSYRGLFKVARDSTVTRKLTASDTSTGTVCKDLKNLSHTQGSQKMTHGVWFRTSRMKWEILCKKRKCVRGILKWAVLMINISAIVALLDSTRYRESDFIYLLRVRMVYNNIAIVSLTSV